MKKLIYLMLASMFLFGCMKPQTKEPFNGLESLKRYYSEVELQLISDKKTSTYNLTIYYDEDNDDIIKVDNDRIYNYGGGRIVITDILNNKNYEVNEDFDKIFHSIFCHKYINNYILSGKSLSKLEKMEYIGKKYFVLPIEKLESESYYYVSGKLLINCELLIPSFLFFMDDTGNVTLKATYNNFYKSS